MASTVLSQIEAKEWIRIDPDHHSVVLPSFVCLDGGLISLRRKLILWSVGAD
jgi:hypothetical protein